MTRHDLSSVPGTTRAGGSTSSLSSRLAQAAPRLLAILILTLISPFTVALADQLDLSASTYQLDEDDGLATISVTRSGAGSVPVTVDYTTSAGSAMPGVDYFDLHGTLSFTIDEVSQVFQVRVFDNHLPSPTKTVNIQISNATGGATIGLGTAILSIIDNDTPGRPILQADQIIEFGPVDVGQVVTRPVSLMNKGLSPLSLSPPVVVAGSELGFSILSPPPLSLPPGQGTTFSVSFRPDAVGSPAGGIVIQSNGGNEVVLLRASGIDTALPTVQLTSPVGGETFQSGSPVNITFTASDLDQLDIIDVDYSVNGGGSFQPITSVYESQSIAWHVPVDLQTTTGVIRVTARDRSGNTAGAQSPPFSVALPPQPSVFLDDVKVIEGSGGGTLCTFTVTRSPVPGPSVTVNYSTQNGSAVGNDDYLPASGVLSFSPTIGTQTVMVQVTPDAFNEPDETFFVNLTNPTNAVIAKGQGTCTIRNDDALPIATSIVPQSASVGTRVTIRGTNLLGVTGVKFGGVSSSVSPINPASDTSIRVVVPQGAKTGDITLTTGTETFTVTSFKILPKIDSFTPTSGLPGTTVTITGTNLKLPAEVRVGSQRAFHVAEGSGETVLWFRTPPKPTLAPEPLWVYDVANGIAEGPLDFTIQPVAPGSTTPLWTYTSPAPVKVVRGDTSAGTGLTFVGSGSTLRALWSETSGPNVGGTEAWSHDFAPATIQNFPSPVPLSSVSGGGEYLFVAASDGMLYKIDAHTGGTAGVGPSLVRPSCPQDKIVGTPAVQLYKYSDDTFKSSAGEDLVFVATHYECGTTSANRVYALSASNLSIKWTFNDDGSKNVDYFSEGCALDYTSNRLICGANLPSGATGQNSLFAIDTKTGALVWSTNAGSIHNRPMVRSTTRPSVAYVGGNDGFIHAFVIPSSGPSPAEVYVPFVPAAGSGAGIERDMGLDDFDFKLHDKLLVTDTAGSVRSLADLWSTAQAQWTIGGDGRYVTPTVVSPATGRAYVGRSDGKIAEIHSATGQELALASANDASGVYDPSIDFDSDANGGIDRVVCGAGNTVRRFCVPWGDYNLVTAVDASPSVPQTYSLRQNAPNPFNPWTRVEFELPESRQVRLDVFDLQGRRVAALLNEVRPAGRQSVIWDGLRDSGAPAASGIYFAHLTAGDARRSVKMVIAR